MTGKHWGSKPKKPVNTPIPSHCLGMSDPQFEKLANSVKIPKPTKTGFAKCALAQESL
jgi:predicted DNA-binding transcriptional regulator AlpA